YIFTKCILPSSFLNIVNILSTKISNSLFKYLLFCIISTINASISLYVFFFFILLYLFLKYFFFYFFFFFIFFFSFFFLYFIFLSYSSEISEIIKLQSIKLLFFESFLKRNIIFLYFETLPIYISSV